jgi:hypothetical protein
VLPPRAVDASGAAHQHTTKPLETAAVGNERCHHHGVHRVHANTSTPHPDTRTANTHTHTHTHTDFRTTKVGRGVTHQLVKNLERFGLAPKGSLEVCHSGPALFLGACA